MEGWMRSSHSSNDSKKNTGAFLPFSCQNLQTLATLGNFWRGRRENAVIAENCRIFRKLQKLQENYWYQFSPCFIPFCTGPFPWPRKGKWTTPVQHHTLSQKKMRCGGTWVTSHEARSWCTFVFACKWVGYRSLLFFFAGVDWSQLPSTHARPPKKNR